IGLEILPGSELGRIDEKACHDAIGQLARATNQGQVALVQAAHGRDQRDPLAGGLPGGDLDAKFGDSPDDRRGGKGHGRPHSAKRSPKTTPKIAAPHTLTLRAAGVSGELTGHWRIGRRKWWVRRASSWSA